MTKRFAAFVLAAVMLFSTSVLASSYAKITGTTSVTVVEVIDGDAMVVKSIANGQLSLVRLMGIKVEGNTKTYEYITNRLLGQGVILSTDSFAPSNSRFSFVYLTHNGIDINAMLLKLGLAKLDTEQKAIKRYENYVSNEAEAKRLKLGVWAQPGAAVKYIGENPININTATESQLVSAFAISSSVAKNIVSYRTQNPFNDYLEIRFVSGFTQEYFENNRDNITVCTDINSADADELTFLGLSSVQITNLIKERTRLVAFTSVNQLHSLSIMSRSFFNTISPYIALEQKFSIEKRVDDIVVNVNTASLLQLQYAGITKTEANEIIKQAGKFMFHSFDEIEKTTGIYRSIVNEYQDNLTFFTDINSADFYELSSLFGDKTTAATIANTIIKNRPYSSVSELSEFIDETTLAEISDAAYCYDVPGTRNIATASTEDFEVLGMSSELADYLSVYGYSYSAPKNIPVDYYTWRSVLTLYTNVNTAGYDEILALPGITSEIANEIYMRRSIEPFAYLTEIKQICDELELPNVYRLFSGYIVFR